MKLTISKKFQDNNLIELRINAINEFITLTQNCFIEDKDLIINSSIILNFLESNDKNCFVSFGKIDVNYTPAFSILFEKIDTSGHFQLEFDCEICDDIKRTHRAKFFLTFDYINVKRLAEYLFKISNENYFDEITI